MGGVHAGRLAAMLGAALVVTAACADKGVAPEELRAWVGRPVATLEKDWGTATREIQDGELRILIYEEIEKRSPKAFDESSAAAARARFFGNAGIGHAQAMEIFRTPTVYVRSYVFWVDRAGTIVNSAVRTP